MSDSLVFTARSLLDMGRNPFFKIIKDEAIGTTFDGGWIYEMVLKSSNTGTFWKGVYVSKQGRLTKTRFFEIPKKEI